MSFGFGNQASTGGFSFGNTATTTKSTGFSFGSTTTQQSSGFSFGTGNAAQTTTSSMFSAPSGGNMFGGAKPTTTTTASGFGFGQKLSTTPVVSSTSATGFSFNAGNKVNAGMQGAAPIFGTTSQPTTSAPPAFGQSNPGSATNIFGLPAATTAAASTGFSLGGTTQPASTQSTGFGIGGGASTQSSVFGSLGSGTTSSGFGLASTIASTAATPFANLGAQKPLTGFSLGGATATSTVAPAFGHGQNPVQQLNFSTPIKTTSSLSGLTTNVAPTTTSSTAPSSGIFGGTGIKLGGDASSTTSGLRTLGQTSANIFGKTTQASTSLAPSSGIFPTGSQATTTPSTTSTATPSLSLPKFGSLPTTSTSQASTTTGAATITTSGSQPFSLSTSTTGLATSLSGIKTTTQPVSTTTQGIQLGSTSAFGGFGQSSTTVTKLPASSTSLPGFPATSATSTTKPANLSLGIATTSSAAAAAASSTTTSQAPSLRYKDLETKINKWTAELEQQEHLFLTQATQVNAWNKLLIDNSEKITSLNSEFERVQCDQERLNQELDLIKTQEQELEELLAPLEEATRHQVASLSSTIHANHADIEREKIYNLVENVDSQMKRMVQDLREVIDHINTSSTPSDSTNPINQISKILSAHMDSLQWLDNNSSALQRKLDELKKQVTSRKTEQESRFRLAFD